MKDTGFARYYVERLDKTLWCIPFAFVRKLAVLSEVMRKIS